MSSFYEFTCYGCGDLSDTPLCYLCTCEQCETILIDGTCSKCNSGAGNSFVYDLNPKSFNEVQSTFSPPPLPHYNIYLCQLCESNSHYGYECSQRFMLVYEPEPCYNQSFGDNDYPHDSPGYSVNQPLDIQNELNNHELFINELIQQKLQKENENAQLFPAIAITLNLPTVVPEDSLRMGDEHLGTIPETESDEIIKSSVENLVPSPSESEDERECDVPACDDFITFSNLLFDADDDFSSNDNESFFDEDIPKEIYLNPLFDEEIISIKIGPHHLNVESDLLESLLNQNYSIISSSKIDSLLDDFIRLIEKLLYDNSSPRPLEEFISKNSDVAIESFSPSPIPVDDSDSLRDEIDLSLTSDDSMPPGIEDDDYDSEGDIIILKELLSNDSRSLPENESFHFDIPSSPCPPAKPSDDEIEPNSGILTVKLVGDIFEHYVPMPRLLSSQPTLASNQEKSPHLLSHRGLKAFQLSFESPMMIHGGNIPILDVPFLHFYPP
nr:hypothetical protein [Tanacetum cinerariifolium]